MPKVVSMQIMHESANTICQILENISKRNMLESVTPELLQLLIEKSCTFSQATTYNRDVNHALVNTMHKKDPRLNGLSEMEQISFKLANHESFVGMENSEAGSTIQQIPMRIAYLYNHLKDFMHSHITDLN